MQVKQNDSDGFGSQMAKAQIPAAPLTSCDFE